jgi:hypothetical protein
VQTNAAKEDVEAMVKATVDQAASTSSSTRSGGRIGRIDKKSVEIMEHGSTWDSWPLWAMRRIRS